MGKDHKISLLTAILLNANIMIGAGIYALPPLMAQKSGFASFLGWPIVAIIFLPLVISIARMANIFPGEGSFYSYSEKLINPTAGFVSGWAYYLTYTGVASLLAICLRDDIILNNFNISPITFNILFILLITLLSLFNIKTVGRIQNTGTIFKVLPLLTVTAIFLAYWNPAFSITTQNISSVPSIVPLVLFGFLGFESCCSISHLIVDSKRNAPKAILIAFFSTAALYAIFHFGLLHIMGASSLASGSTQDFVNFLGMPSLSVKSFFSTFIALSLGLTFANSVFSLFTTTSSMIQAMANKNLLPGSNHLSKESEQNRPWVAIIAQGVLTFIIISSTSNKNLLVSLVDLGILTSFFLTLISLSIHQRRKKLQKQFMVTALAFISWGIFVYFSWFEIGDTIIKRLTGSSSLLIAMAIGVSMYLYKKRCS